jgi:hypothetical protein
MVLNAQPTPQYLMFSTADGLSQGMINTVLQRRNGFVRMVANSSIKGCGGIRFAAFVPGFFRLFCHFWQ